MVVNLTTMLKLNLNEPMDCNSCLFKLLTMAPGLLVLHRIGEYNIKLLPLIEVTLLEEEIYWNRRSNNLLRPR